MKKKNLAALIALVLAAAMVLAGCSGQSGSNEEELLQQIANLEQEKEALENQVKILTDQLEALESAVLTDWSLDAKANQDRTGATVSFTAVPATQKEGQTVSLIVTLNGFEAESVQCAPEGDHYYGTVELPAADGYGFYCIITGESGNQQQIPLVTAENGTNDALVNLGTSLNAYCNFFVESWDYAGGKLTVKSGFIQAQMPLISNGDEEVTATKAELVFLHNGEEVARTPVTLADGEAEGSYETAVTDVSFTVPKLEDDHQLDLVLEVQLSSGSSISYNGCSWYVNGNDLNPVMG